MDGRTFPKYRLSKLVIFNHCDRYRLLQVDSGGEKHSSPALLTLHETRLGVHHKERTVLDTEGRQPCSATTHQ